MWNIENQFKIKIGGNYYINVTNLIVASGESLFRVKRREEDGLLAVDFDVYDAQGKKVATIRNAHIVGGNADDYEFHKERHHYWVVERKSGRTICDVKQVGKAEDGVELEIAVDLFTKSGFHLIASPEQTNIGNLTMKGGTISGAHTGLAVG